MTGEAVAPAGSKAAHQRVSRVSAQILETCLRAAVQSGDHVALTVRGDCMEPGLKDGDIVDIRRTRWYFPGDVVAYFNPFEDRYLVHRFLGYVRSGGVWKCLVMPDRGAKPDVLVECSRALGKVVEDRDSNFAWPGACRVILTTCRYIYWVLRIALQRCRRRGPAPMAGPS